MFTRGLIKIATVKCHHAFCMSFNDWNCFTRTLFIMIISSRRSLMHRQQCSPEIIFTLYVWTPRGFGILLVLCLNRKCSSFFVCEFYALLSFMWPTFDVLVHTVSKFALGESESLAEKSIFHHKSFSLLAGARKYLLSVSRIWPTSAMQSTEAT